MRRRPSPPARRQSGLGRRVHDDPLAAAFYDIASAPRCSGTFPACGRFRSREGADAEHRLRLRLARGRSAQADLAVFFRRRRHAGADQGLGIVVVSNELAELGGAGPGRPLPRSADQRPHGVHRSPIPRSRGRGRAGCSSGSITNGLTPIVGTADPLKDVGALVAALVAPPECRECRAALAPGRPRRWTRRTARSARRSSRRPRRPG